MAARSQSETRQRRAPDRYEFRVWGDDLSALFTRLREAGKDAKPEESSEVYVVSRCRSAFNSKILDGRLDVKQLIGTRNRLELWHPYLKARFPLRRRSVQDDARKVLSLEGHNDWGAIDTAEAFIRTIVEPCPHMISVPLRKTRTRFGLGPCSAEFVAVTVGEVARQTMCIESEEAAAVLRVAACLGLGERENLNYQQALRAMLGIDDMTRADSLT